MQQQPLIIHRPQPCIDTASSWVMNAPKTCVFAFMVPLPLVLCISVHMSVCHCVLIYVYICADRESGWLLPAVWQLHSEARCRHHHSAGSSLRYIPRRAVLYCPGNDERKLKKLASLDVDCAVLDCEDGVALTKKVHLNEMQLFMNKEHTNTSIIVWSWLILIEAPTIRQVLGLYQKKTP